MTKPYARLSRKVVYRFPQNLARTHEKSPIMNRKQFQSYLIRDRQRCVHCGVSDDTLIPQHRKNRGMGGSKARDVPSNIIVMCSSFNFLIEADSNWAIIAKNRGWKLESWQDPLDTPVYYAHYDKYYVLDNEFHKTEAREETDADNQGRT